MKIKEVEHINEFMIWASKELMQSKYVSPRGLKTLEIEDAIMILKNPKNCIITLPERKLNIEYLNAEMKWYLSGKKDISFISKYSSIWDKIKNPDNTANSNYGFLVFKQKFNGLNQFDWCLNKLKEDKETRQAIINYNQPWHKYLENKDFVCTLNQQFRINNNKLDSRVIMRSNDLIYGFSYDIPWFVYLQTKLAKKLDIEIGTYLHYAMSLHVYERHFELLKNIYKLNYKLINSTGDNGPK